MDLHRHPAGPQRRESAPGRSVAGRLVLGHLRRSCRLEQWRPPLNGSPRSQERRRHQRWIHGCSAMTGRALAPAPRSPAAIQPGRLGGRQSADLALGGGRYLASGIGERFRRWGNGDSRGCADLGHLDHGRWEHGYLRRAGSSVCANRSARRPDNDLRAHLSRIIGQPALTRRGPERRVVHRHCDRQLVGQLVCDRCARWRSASKPHHVVNFARACGASRERQHHQRRRWSGGIVVRVQGGGL